MNVLPLFTSKCIAAVLAGLLGIGACSPRDDEPRRATGATATTSSESPPATDEAPYAFDQPTDSFELPAELTEISGLAMLDDVRLAAVQDEDGILFMIDAASGEVDSQVEFDDSGDYEGVALAGDRLFVLQSNGNLIEVRGWLDGPIDTRDHKTDLKGRNDTEGLVYDRSADRLLIVTKEDPGGDLDEDRHRAVYAFDLATSEIDETPVAVIDLEAIEGVVDGLRSFKPSALAIHPDSGDLYVLSSNDQSLAVLGPGGEMRGAWRLSAELFEQPEGLAFSSGGDLFISSEGVAGPPMLFRFAPAR